MSNRVNLTLDVTKKGVQNPLIKIRQGDGDFETLRTTVLSNGEPLDLQGWTITFMATTAGNHKIVDSNATVVEAQNGVFDYTPSKAWGMDVGDFKIAYFKLTKDDGSASSANFRVEVIKAIDLTQEEAQNYISVVDATIAETREHLENSLADVSSSVAAISVATSSMAVSVSSVASSAVSQVSSTASNASSVASSAVDKVNGVAAQVNNLSIGGRNYMLNSSYKLSGSAISYANFSSSIPISKLSNNVITLSAQFDYDSITALNNQKRLGFEISAIQILSDGTSKSIFFGVWINNPALGSSFHGRKSATYNLTNQSIVAKSDESPNSWGGGLYIQGIIGTNVSVSNPKIEIGNFATDWTPAPEDAPSNDAQLVHKTNNETLAGDKTLVGNTSLATTTILAGSYGLRVTASGIQKTTDGKTWVSANI